MVPGLSIGSAQQLFSRKISQFPLLQQYLVPSLQSRLQTEHWFENRVVRYVLRDSSWVQDLENTFQESQFDSIDNSEEIFGIFQGTEQDYDEQLFDALAEVRLARWARCQGYREIEKLRRAQKSSTPDFRMKRDAKIVLAEAKHFRVRDYLVYFIADRLEGLGLMTGGLPRFGFLVDTGNDYNRQRDNLVSNRSLWIGKARAELTEDWLRRAERQLESDDGAEAPLLDGLFVVRRSATTGPGRVLPALMGMLDPKETVKLCLSKLQGDLTKKLGQKEFMGATGTNANQAIVFFSGIDEWEPEWDKLWSTLEGQQGQWAWDYVDQIKKDADTLIGMPFELIVGRYQKKGRRLGGEVQYGPMEYVSFPWKPRGP